MRRLLIALLGVALLLSSAACCGASNAAKEAASSDEAAPTQTQSADNATEEPPTMTPFLFVVANTDGDGVYIRKTPDMGDKLKVWPEGAAMVVVGKDQETVGRAWKNVKDPDGNVGWVPAEYLAEPTPTPEPTATPDMSRYQLELLAVNGTKQYGFITVQGQVKNISSQPLSGVWVVVQHYTADGTFVKATDGIVDYDPILPGQTSPFTAMDTDNPAMTKYDVSFKFIFGGKIPTYDGRKD